MVACGLMALLLVLVRGNLLWTAGMQNPDEAELMAEGRSAGTDLFPYRGYTSSTHLFLWPFTLGVLDRFGVPMTLVTAHVIGGLSYVFLSTTGWFLMMRRIGGVRAALLVLPTALVLLVGYANGTSDFLSMTSEALPLVILCIAALVMLGPNRPMSSRRLAVGSIVAGLAMWAKPQAGPVAVALIAACVLITFVERQRSEREGSPVTAIRFVIRSGILGLVAFVTPTVVFLGLMALGGTLDDFAREPVAAMWGYAADRDVTQGVVAPSLDDRLAGLAAFASSFPFAAAWALGGLLSISLVARLESKLLRGLAVAAVVLPVAAALTCLLPIYPLFPHYANFIYLGCLLASCVAVRLVDPGRVDTTYGRWVEGTYFGVAFAVVGMLMLSVVPGQLRDMAGQARSAVTGDGLSFRNEVHRDATPLGAACPADSRVLTWGWASELYAYYDWEPASRYANSTWLMNPGEHQAEYGRILQRELEQNPPNCIVEALGPAFFYSIDPATTLRDVVPGTSPLLDACYTRSEEVTFEQKPVTLYHRDADCARAGSST
jgi:hypothetical protein